MELFIRNKSKSKKSVSMEFYVLSILILISQQMWWNLKIEMIYIKLFINRE